MFTAGLSLVIFLVALTQDCLPEFSPSMPMTTGHAESIFRLMQLDFDTAIPGVSTRNCHLCLDALKCDVVPFLL